MFRHHHPNHSVCSVHCHHPPRGRHTVRLSTCPSLSPPTNGNNNNRPPPSWAQLGRHHHCPLSTHLGLAGGWGSDNLPTCLVCWGNWSVTCLAHLPRSPAHCLPCLTGQFGINWELGNVTELGNECPLQPACHHWFGRQVTITPPSPLNWLGESMGNSIYCRQWSPHVTHHCHHPLSPTIITVTIIHPPLPGRNNGMELINCHHHHQLGQCHVSSLGSIVE